MKRLALLLALTGGASAAQAQDYRSAPERRVVAERDWGPWLGPFRARLVPSLMEDFGERYLYADANRALGPPASGEQRVVFLGDSITDGWNLAEAFPGRPFVNRGIGSQVTAQMLLRFHQDVVGLRPSAVVILAGVNDVTGFLQRETSEQIQSNYEAMADLADRHGIAMVFGSILPVHDYTEAARGVVADRRPEQLRALNDWLRLFCLERGYAFADYWAVLADPSGRLGRQYSADGIHPLAAGYARMVPVAEAAIEAALAARQSDVRGQAEQDAPGFARPKG